MFPVVCLQTSAELVPLFVTVLHQPLPLLHSPNAEFRLASKDTDTRTLLRAAPQAVPEPSHTGVSLVAFPVGALLTAKSA